MYDDLLKQFYAHVKVIEFYGVKTLVHPGLVKANLINMEVPDVKKPTPKENKKAEQEANEEYMSCLILDQKKTAVSVTSRPTYITR